MRNITALHNNPFFSGIPIDSLRRLANHVDRVSFAASETIFVEGGSADRFFVLHSGLVRLDLRREDGDEVEVATLGADAAFGWSWLFPPYRWQLSATAVERTTALVFDATVMRALMAADPVTGYELMRRFASVIFERLRATRAQLASGDTSVMATTVSGPWAGKPAMSSTLAPGPRAYA